MIGRCMIDCCCMIDHHCYCRRHHCYFCSMTDTDSCCFSNCRHHSNCYRLDIYYSNCNLVLLCFQVLLFVYILLIRVLLCCCDIQIVHHYYYYHHYHQYCMWWGALGGTSTRSVSQCIKMKKYDSHVFYLF